MTNVVFSAKDLVLAFARIKGAAFFDGYAVDLSRFTKIDTINISAEKVKRSLTLLITDIYGIVTAENKQAFVIKTLNFVVDSGLLNLTAHILSYQVDVLVLIRTKVLI
ncbi:MAG: hypothetical protein LBP79_07700 [Clostridiales bacterium]|nr:hypothetical protein [Clostridiales bacterium]